jgi:hypothetical protein
MTCDTCIRGIPCTVGMCAVERCRLRSLGLHAWVPPAPVRVATGTHIYSTKEGSHE